MTQKGEDANEETGNQKYCFERQKLKIYVVIPHWCSSQNLEGFGGVGRALGLAAPAL